MWTAAPAYADRFLASQRKQGLARSTVQHKAWALAHFFDFLIAQYQGDVHRLTGHLVEQVIDEYNRPAQADCGAVRLPPSDEDVDLLFGAWREWLPHARKFLPAARDYLAASLWRRAGLRIQETYMPDIRDWRRDLGSTAPCRCGSARAPVGGDRRPGWCGHQQCSGVAGLVGWSMCATSLSWTMVAATPSPSTTPNQQHTHQPPPKQHSTARCDQAGQGGLASGPPRPGRPDVL